METVKVIEMETDGAVLQCPLDPKNDESEYGLVVSNPAAHFEVSVRDAAKAFGVSEIFVEQILGAFELFADQVQSDLKSIWNRLDKIEGKK